MKITIIGAGSVGGLAAMRIAESGLGSVVLIDIAKGLAEGKSLDLDDSRFILKNNYSIQAADDFVKIKDSDIVVITAGLARKPGETREGLLEKNSRILKEVCLNIKNTSPEAIVLVVTNPLDLMTYLALKTTGFSPKKVFGMGISLDASRFANLISKELNIPVTDIQPCVIASHGEAMLPLARLTTIKGVALDEFLNDAKISALIKQTIERGREIVSLLGSGSAYFAPSAAIAEIVKIIAKDEKRIIGLSVYLNGEYGLKDICLGLPCRLGRQGIEQIIELDLKPEEKEGLFKAAASLKQQFSAT